jgi:hypothetical protein
MSQQPINRGSLPNDGTGDTAYVMSGQVNANFAELYASLSPPIILSNRTGNISQALVAKTNISKMYFGVVSGTPSLKIGTVPNGNDVLPLSSDFSEPFLIEQFFSSATTLYFTITGGNINIQIDAKTINV